MGCVTSPLLFIMSTELILSDVADTAKGVFTKEQLVLPPPGAFVDGISILFPSKVSADEMMQHYYILIMCPRIKSKPKKSRSL